MTRPQRTRRSRPAAERAEAVRESRGLGSLAVSVLLHAAMILLAVLWVVKRIFLAPEETVFEPPAKRVHLPAQIREQRMSVARHDAMAPRPSYSQRVAASVPSAGAVRVPQMPEMNLSKMLPLDPSELVSDQISGLIGAAGYGRGTGRGLSGGGGTGSGTGMAFFDIREAARSVAILIDVSQSMFSRTGDYDPSTRKLLRTGRDQAFQVVRDEAIRLIDSLGPDTRFGIIRWSGSARSWKPELMRATDANKADARAHIQNEVDANSAPPTGGRPGGTRHDYALEELLRLNPETAFMLTDGNATRSTGRGGMEPIPAAEILAILDEQARHSESLPRINVIYYVTGADRKEEEDLLRDIARRTKGKFRKVTAAGAAERRNDRSSTDRRPRTRERPRSDPR